MLDGYGAGSAVYEGFHGGEVSDLEYAEELGPAVAMHQRLHFTIVQQTKLHAPGDKRKNQPVCPLGIFSYAFGVLVQSLILCRKRVAEVSYDERSSGLLSIGTDEEALRWRCPLSLQTHDGMIPCRGKYHIITPRTIQQRGVIMPSCRDVT